jgi:hypothetical protein
MALIAQLVGGPHDGERIVRPPSDPLPERLVAVTFTDGAQYARVREEIGIHTGEPPVVLRYDVDGSLTLAAKVAAGIDLDAPDREHD